MEGMGEEKLYFPFLKSVKCKKAQFRAVSQLILSPIVGYLKSIFCRSWVTVFFFVLILFFFSVWLQLTEEMEKAQSLIDDMSSQLNEVKIRLVSDYHSFSDNAGNYCVWSPLLLSSVWLYYVLMSCIWYPKYF